MPTTATNNEIFKKVMKMAVKILDPKKKFLVQDFKENVESILNGPIVDRCNRQQKASNFHRYFREWLRSCIHGKPEKDVMNHEAWGTTEGVEVLKPSIDASTHAHVYALPESVEDNILISQHLRRFLTYGFIFFDPKLHKISLDGPIVPEDYMKEKKNAFGPLFMDIVWNGFLYYALKLGMLFQLILVGRDNVLDIMAMSITEKVRIIENHRSLRRKQSCLLFQAHTLSTLLWMCEVAVDPEDKLRIDGGVRRSQLYEMIVSEGLDTLFIDKFHLYLKTKKEQIAEQQVVAHDECVVAPTTNIHPLLKENPLVSARLAIDCLIYERVSMYGRVHRNDFVELVNLSFCSAGSSTE